LRVRVMLTAMFREAAGRKEVVEELPEGSKLLDLIRRLEAKFDGAFSEVLDRESGSVDEEVMVLINGVAVRKVDEELRDGDSVLLTIPIMGGAERA
jgi:molybdopterin synthase sulfur carrier subunit